MFVTKLENWFIHVSVACMFASSAAKLPGGGVVSGEDVPVVDVDPAESDSVEASAAENVDSAVC